MHTVHGAAVTGFAVVVSYEPVLFAEQQAVQSWLSFIEYHV
jgi:hypothetical protein